MKQLNKISTQQQLSFFIQNLSKSEKFSKTSKETGFLTVIDSSKLAKLIKTEFKTHANKELLEQINNDISNILDEKKIPIAMEVVSEIFKDVSKYFLFSKSKKMMKRIIKNAKS